MWAEQAGAFLVNRPDGMITDTKSTDTDLVTEMDRGSETLLVAAISNTFPNDGILGEEGANRASTSGRKWVIDPLDGTVNYFYRLPMWCVSIGLQDADGNGLVGVVHSPLMNLTCVAIAGRGAFRIVGNEAVQLHASSPSVLGHSLIATGFGYSANRRQGQARVLSSVIHKVRDIRRAGSAAIDLCWVAMGSLDGYFERGVSPWDWAAGALIATEAGAVVTGLRTAQPNDEMLVAGARTIYNDLRNELLDCNADSDPADD